MKRTFYVKISPSFGKVKVISVSHQAIVVRSQFASAAEKINITGWKLKTQKGEITIPLGIELFLPSASSPSSLFLKQSDQINVLSSKNTFLANGAIRPNKCFGYLKDSYSSWPYSLPADSKVCPKINKEQIGLLSKDCQKAIFNLESCKPLDYTRYPQAYAEPTCQSFVENYTGKYLNYNGCLENYKKDKAFLKNSWYFYAGYDIVCNCNDNVFLYDQNGLLVNKYNYRM